MSPSSKESTRPTLFIIVWKSITSFFREWCWRIYIGAYVLLAIAFYIWVGHGDDIALDFVKWLAPLMLGMLVKVIIDTHVRFTEFIDPIHLDSRKCVEKIVERLKKTARRKHSPGKPISIDVMGVSLHNSQGWIETELMDFMKKHPKVYIELRLVFVEPEFLRNLNFSTNPIDWAEKSRDRIDWVSKTLWKLAARSDGRLRVHVRLIENLPHWHGILIERHYLFLGRVSWEDGTERFHARPLNLTCASNGYRYFDRDDKSNGDDRVDLFRRWMAHYLYGTHSGKDLADNISSFYRERDEIAPR